MHYITSLFRNGLDEPEHLFLAATSVSRILPSDAGIFKPLQFVTVSLPSFFNFVFKTLQYVVGFSLLQCLFLCHE